MTVYDLKIEAFVECVRAAMDRPNQFCEDLDGAIDHAWRMATDYDTATKQAGADAARKRLAIR